MRFFFTFIISLMCELCVLVSDTGTSSTKTDFVDRFFIYDIGTKLILQLTIH